MTEIAQWFAAAADEFCLLVADAASLPLASRCIAFRQALASVYAGALQLPQMNSLEAPPDSENWPTEWPGFGSLEESWLRRSVDEAPIPSTISADLEVVYVSLSRGLSMVAGSPEGAVAWWSSSFSSWAPHAISALAALQLAAERFHEDTIAPPESPARTGPTDAFVLIAPREEPSAVPAPVGPPMIGVRFKPVGGGVEVLAVVSGGPAAGQLTPGDVILAAAGHSLDGLSEAEAGGLLVGEVGETRSLDVYRDGETLAVPLTPIAASVVVTTFRVRLVDAQVASEALATLSILGVDVQQRGDRLVVHAPGTVANQVRGVLEAGMKGGVWILEDGP